MIYLVYTIHVVVCLFLILVVLLQQGKGADLSVFGGGSTQSAFGARGAATLLHKLTVSAFIAFIVTTITIGFLQGHGRVGSVMSTVGDEAPPVTAPDQPAAESEAAVEPEATASEATSTEPAAEGSPAADDGTGEEGTVESDTPDGPSSPPGP